MTSSRQTICLAKQAPWDDRRALLEKSMNGHEYVAAKDTVPLLVTVAGLAPETGGPAKSVPALCSHLASADLPINLCSLELGNKFGRPVVPNSRWVRTHFTRCYYSHKLRLQWAPMFDRDLRSLIRNQKIKLIHDHGIWLWSNHVVARITRQLKLPLMVSPRGMISPWTFQRRPFQKWLAWYSYQRRNLHTTSVLHATSRMEAQYLRNLGLKRPIALIPNGVELPPEKGESLKSRNGRVALFLGRLHPSKGLLNLVEAWAAVRPKGWRVVIAGPDENNHQTEVINAVERHDLSTCFHFAGMVEGDKKWDLYRQADLFVLPTHTENFGLAIAEALACSVPVIATKGAPWSELDSHHCGWWIDIGVNPLIDALKKAIQLTDFERNQMGERGRKLVRDRYSWSQVAEQMGAVYRWMLGQGETPNCILEECGRLKNSSRAGWPGWYAPSTEIN